MPITWKPHIREGLALDPSEVDRLEQSWRVKLPADYKEAILKYQGMRPKPCVFRVGQGEDVLSVLMTLDSSKGRNAFSVHRMYELLKPHVPEGIYPFGKTAGGQHVCFDYRSSPEVPKVVLVTVEAEVHPVSDTFKEFLEGLYDPDATGTGA